MYRSADNCYGFTTRPRVFSTRTHTHKKHFELYDFLLESFCWELFKCTLAWFSLQKRPKDIPRVLQLRQTLLKHLGDGCVFRLANLNSWCTEKKGKLLHLLWLHFPCCFNKSKVYFHKITVHGALRCFLLSQCSSSVLKHLPQHGLSNRCFKIGGYFPSSIYSQQ